MLLSISFVMQGMASGGVSMALAAQPQEYALHGYEWEDTFEETTDGLYGEEPQLRASFYVNDKECHKYTEGQNGPFRP